MTRVFAQLRERGHLGFADLFEPGMHKSKLIGLFLAVLELVRHAGVRVEQNRQFGEIWLLPPTNEAATLDISHVDNYDHAHNDDDD